MADIPFDLAPELSTRLARALDIEGKIPRAFDALAPIRNTDVVLVGGAADGLRARQLSELGARLTVADASSPDPLAGIADASADTVVSLWSWSRDDLPAAFASAQRVLRTGGRLLVLHDYGRDDVSRLQSPELPEYTTWSRRDGWFMRAGFKLRVIHCWWTFASLEEAAGFLADAFGEAGRAVGSALKRPRMSYNVAIFHWTKGGEPVA